MGRALAALVVFLAVTLVPGSARADHTWGPLHWPGGPDKAFVMVSDRSGLGLPVDAAIAEWNRSSVLNIVNVGPVCPNTFAPHYCLTIYADHEMSEWAGWATFHTLGGPHILAADIRLGTRGSAPWDVRYAILLHEMGHGLGLNHRPRGVGSIMEPVVGAGMRPDGHDFWQLEQNRPH